MNRVIEKLKSVKNGGKIFCAYLTLGYPSVQWTERLIRAFEMLRVDMVEIGIPFSDPLADGPVIQKASEWALKRRVGLEDAFRLGVRLRRRSVRIPLIFFSYYNPIFHFGTDRFVSDLKKSGFDGLLCPDLPPDEESFLPAQLKRNGISLIYLASPTTDLNRMKLIARKTSGFIYYVSLKGVTGIRKHLARDLREKIKRLKRVTPKPVLVGFGISDAKQAREVCRTSDGIIVGSAIINAIKKSRGRMRDVLRFVGKISEAVHREDPLS